LNPTTSHSLAKRIAEFFRLRPFFGNLLKRSTTRDDAKETLDLQIKAGDRFDIPRVPWKKVGTPRRLAAIEDQLQPRTRTYRSTYDWKAYTADQLKVMEGYWDGFAKRLQSFLPPNQKPGSRTLRGINLGTFNGGFQKAWMRLGYTMYGIELTNVVDELHEYGCEGEQASFFDMPAVPSESFDFGFMDRCLCNAHFHKVFLKDSSNTPSFAEPFRVLKPGGTLVLILYPYWTGSLIRELARYGPVELGPTSGWRPLLWVRVTKTGLPSDVPTVEKALESLNSQLQCQPEPHGTPDHPLTERALEALSSHPHFFNPNRTPDGALRFLYLPDNHLCEATVDSGGGLRLKRAAFWDDVPWKEQFFLASDLRLEPVDPQQDSRRRLMIIADSPRYFPHRPKRGYSQLANQALNKHFNVINIANDVRGTRSALAYLDEIAQELHGGVALVSLTHHDSRINRRTGASGVDLEVHRKRLEAILHQLQEKNIDVIVFEGFSSPLSTFQGNDADRAAHEEHLRAIEQFNRADLELAESLGCKIVPLTAELHGGDGLFRRRGLTRKGKQRLSDLLLAAAADLA
jgi:SAM-dependent methyltransferase